MQAYARKEHLTENSEPLIGQQNLAGTLFVTEYQEQVHPRASPGQQ